MSAGDQNGGGELEAAYLSHRALLLRHAQDFLGPRRTDASDFVQDTMERLLAHFPEGPPPEPACTGWLVKTLTHLLISDWRKHRVRHNALSDPTLPQAMTPQPVVSLDSVRPPSMMEKVMEKITAEDFNAAVNSLSRKLRPVFELHVLELSHAEIATRLGISVGASRRRLHAARRHLAARLKLDLIGAAP